MGWSGDLQAAGLCHSQGKIPKTSFAPCILLPLAGSAVTWSGGQYGEHLIANARSGDRGAGSQSLLAVGPACTGYERCLGIGDMWR